MGTWKPQSSKIDPSGITVNYLRGGGEGGHRIDFPDGRMILALPDDTSTATGRAKAIKTALDHLLPVVDSYPAETGGLDPLAYVLGHLRLTGSSNHHIIEATR